jgi:hypothetical protein
MALVKRKRCFRAVCDSVLLIRNLITQSVKKSSSGSLSISASPESRVLAARDRLDIIRQCILRNEHFAPSTLPSRDREKLVTLKSTKQLLGRPGQRFLLLGMLTHNKEGKMCLEDADGSVVLDYSTLVSLASAESES